MFLLRHKVQKGEDYTHTSFATPSGAFYVGGDDDEIFMNLYIQEYVKGSKLLHLTERPKDIFSAIVDLDLRYPLESELYRRHTLEDTLQFVKVYVNELNKLLVLPDHVDIYVLQKPSPIVSSTYIKDGVHLILPNVVTQRSVQLLVREATMPQVDEIFTRGGSVNPIVDIYDAQVLSRNNWMMVGSRKPGQDPYKLSSILRWKASDGTVSEAPEAFPPTELLPKLLSIRRNPLPCKVRQEHECVVKNRETALFTVPQHVALGSQPNAQQNRCGNRETVEKLVSILNAARADDYDSWMRTGWMLRNIDHRLLDVWIQFSRKSRKYVEGECASKWNHMRSDGNLGMGTLRMWAKQDDAEAYQHIMAADLAELIKLSSSGTHTDVARVVKRMYGDQFVCASLRLNMWYEFQGHTWSVSDGACELRKLLSTDVYSRYKEGARSTRINFDDNNEARRNQEEHHQRELLKVAFNLKDTNFKDKVIKECREHFYVERFEDKLDANPNLIGFQNGVYDMEKHEFRDGRPDDYITYSTGIAYQPFDRTHPCISEILQFFSQVQPKAHMRQYLLTLLASFISGNIHEEKFHIFTGSGSNGKSRVLELYETTLGDYCCKFPVTLLTQKRIACNAANAELARSKGRRFACMQEPSESEHLNIGLMKELSGGDKITARALYSMPVEFKPMFSMVLMCNHLPSCPSDDNGTWRRIRVVEFASKFVHDPDPNDAHQFPIDLDMSRKFESWRPHFIGLLLEYYRLYQVNGIQEPAEVLATTRDYQRSNDFVADFVSEKIELFADGAMLPVDDLYAEFREWWRLENMKGALPRRREIVIIIEKKFGRVDQREGYQFFNNMRVKSRA